MSDPSSTPMPRPGSPAGRPPAGPPPPAATLEHALFEVKKVIVGQDRAIERLFVCLLARGHGLLEGVPGLAKTLAVETLATVVGGTYTRLQFTPDLLPADIVGTRIYRALVGDLRRRARPDLRQLRAGRRDQPGPGQGAVGPARGHGRAPGVHRRHHLRRAQPVPRAGHPEPDRERGRLPAARGPARPLPDEDRDRLPEPGRRGRDRPPHGRPPARWPSRCSRSTSSSPCRTWPTTSTSTTASSTTRSTSCSPPATPTPTACPSSPTCSAFGASPRASLGLVAGARALALLRGRTYALPQDVFDVAPDVLRHRLVLSYEALAQGLTVDQLLDPPALARCPRPGSPRRRTRPRSAGRSHAPARAGPRPPAAGTTGSSPTSPFAAPSS